MDNPELEQAYTAVCKRYDHDIAVDVVIELMVRPEQDRSVKYALYRARHRYINSIRDTKRRATPFSQLGTKQQGYIDHMLYGVTGEVE